MLFKIGVPIACLFLMFLAFVPFSAADEEIRKEEAPLTSPGDGGAWLKRNLQGNGVEVMPRHRGAIELALWF